jgi:hypothetical protein
MQQNNVPCTKTMFPVRISDGVSFHLATKLFTRGGIASSTPICNYLPGVCVTQVGRYLPSRGMFATSSHLTVLYCN